MPSTKENSEFFRDVMPNPSDFLETCIDWIRDRFQPEEIFGTAALDDWAANNGYVKKDDV